jgi:hypothetical protein
MTDRYALAFGTPVTGWSHWFAWHPVYTADRGWRWFESINRRRIRKHDHVLGGSEEWYQHVVDVAGYPTIQDGDIGLSR